MTSGTSYSFPILGNHEILACLNELEMQAEDSQLSKPNYDFVRQLYENLVVLLVGITREEMQQPVFNAIDALEFPELHDESIASITFIKSISKLMRASGIQDFSIVKDLYKPEHPRLKRNLSAIINFAKFREEKLNLFTQLQDASDVASERMQTLTAENAKLRGDIKTLEEARDAEAPQLVELEQATADLESQLRVLNKEQALLQSEIRSTKQATSEVADKASGEKFKILNAQKEKQKLEAQIVESPELLQKALKELQTSIEHEREAVSHNERRSREAGSKVESMAKVEKEILKATRLMEDVEKEIGRYKEFSKKVKNMNAKLVSNETEVISLGASHQHVKRQSQMLSERLNRLQQQSQLKLEAADSTLQDYVRNKENAEAENAATIAKLSNNEAIARSIQDKIHELKATHQLELNTLADKYGTLRHQVQEYHNLLNEAMEARTA